MDMKSHVHALLWDIEACTNVHIIGQIKSGMDCMNENDCGHSGGFVATGL